MRRFTISPSSSSLGFFVASSLSQQQQFRFSSSSSSSNNNDSSSSTTAGNSEGGENNNNNNTNDITGRVPLGKTPFQSPISLRHKAQRMGEGKRQTNSNEGTGDEHLNTTEKKKGDDGNSNSGAKSTTKKKRPIVYGNAAKQEQRNNEFNDGFTPKAKKSNPSKPTSYKRSRDAFADRAILLKTSFAGAASARDITYWENIWYNYVRYFWTREALVGKDRYGNRFTVRWYFLRERQEERRMYRVDKDKQHHPYGALPTDSRLWEAWMRKWRYDPPTNEEDEYHRRRVREGLGVHVVGDEEVEDATMRALAHTKQSAAMMKELDNNDEYGKKSIMNTDARAKENNPGQEHDSTWSTAVVRGDLFYNEEETEVLRNSLAHMFRDKEWQSLELKRQIRLRKQKKPVRKPDMPPSSGANAMDIPADIGDGEAMDHQWDRTDSGVPFGNGVSELTTPELEKLRAECDALEEERIALRKELGLTDIGDYREGRPAIDKGYDPFQPPPTSTRWKPKCWSESWGVGGGHLY